MDSINKLSRNPRGGLGGVFISFKIKNNPKKIYTPLGHKAQADLILERSKLAGATPFPASPASLDPCLQRPQKR